MSFQAFRVTGRPEAESLMASWAGKVASTKGASATGYEVVPLGSLAAAREDRGTATASGAADGGDAGEGGAAAVAEGAAAETIEAQIELVTRAIRAQLRGWTWEGTARPFAIVIAESEKVAGQLMAGRYPTGQVICSEKLHDAVDGSALGRTYIKYYDWDHLPGRRNFVGELGFGTQLPGSYECIYDSRLGQLNAPFDGVFGAEMQWIRERRKSGTVREEVLKGEAAHAPETPSLKNDLYGIALSGGGMRSATFSLGVLQALAARDVLAKADYLSTVSGGSYMGVALQSLCAEELPYDGLPQLGCSPGNFPFAFPRVTPAAPPKESIAAVERTAFEEPVHGNEPPALWNVRKYANLLGNTIGPLDPVTWLTIGRYAVSTLLLFLLFMVPLFGIPIVGGVFVAYWLNKPWAFEDSWGLWVALLLAPAAILLVVAGVAALMSKPATKHGVDRFRLPIALCVALVVATLVALGTWGLEHLFISGSGGRIAAGAATTGASAAVAATGLRKMVLDAGTKSAAALRDSLWERIKKQIPAVLLAVGGYLFLYSGAVLATWGLWHLFLHFHFTIVLDHGWSATAAGQFVFLAALAVLLILQLLPSQWLGTSLLNTMSINHMYAERLQRTWVTSAKPPEERSKFAAMTSRVLRRSRATAPRAQAFSVPEWRDVWPASDVRVKDLRNDSPKTAPYPLICCTLNTPGSRGDKYPERNADSFVIAPLYSGAALSHWKPTREMEDVDALRLSHAAAISGAAVASNMGFQTRSTFSIMTTLFNVRLGQWIKNPRPLQQRGYRRWLGNRPFLFYLKELLGLASRDDGFLYISDGGHFENLGVYELLRRRCRYIIAVTADEEDPGVADSMGNLAQTCRLARIDFGIEIEFTDLAPILKDPKTGAAQSYFGVGRIRYPKAPGATEDADEGIIVVIKSAIVAGQISPDIYQQWRADPKFPYQGILDEQYSLSQFESQRYLGYLAGEAVAGHAPPGARPVNVARWFERIKASFEGLPASPPTLEPGTLAPNHLRVDGVAALAGSQPLRGGR